jgi:hypothetical protein
MLGAGALGGMFLSVLGVLAHGPGSLRTPDQRITARYTRPSGTEQRCDSAGTHCEEWIRPASHVIAIETPEGTERIVEVSAERWNGIVPGSCWCGTYACVCGDP